MLELKKIASSRLISNIYNQFILYGFSHIIPIILIPYLLNTIGVEKYGLINFILAFSFYFQIVNEFGFDLSNVKHVVTNRENPNELSRILSAILSCKCLIIICTSIVYFAIVFFFEDMRNNILAYTFAFIRQIGIIMSPYWFFRSMENIKYITRIVIPIKTLRILPIFFVVTSEDNYIWVMFFYTLETTISGIISLSLVIKKYNLRLRLVPFSDILYFFKDSIPFFTSTFLMRIYKNSNVVILGMFCSDFLVGIYSAAEKLHNAYSSFISPLLSQIFYPYFTRVSNFKIINKIVLAVCIGNIALLALVYILSPIIIPLFIKEEASSIILYFNLFLILLAISVPVDMLGFPYLGVMKMVNKVNSTTIYTSAIYIIGVIIFMLLGYISVLNMILLLIIANIACLIMRLYYIRKNKSSILA